jgi:Skp family chaperone for outer membrane proteins
MKFFLYIILVFTISISPVISKQKIVFVDIDRIVSKSNAGSSIFKQLKTINNKNLIILKKEEKKFKEKEKKLVAQKNIISEADFKDNIDELKSEIKNYNKKRNEMIEKFNKLKVENTNEFLKLINLILVKYSNENEISLILQKKNLIVGKTELDITDEIIKLVNKDIINFEIK